MTQDALLSKLIDMVQKEKIELSGFIVTFSKGKETGAFIKSKSHLDLLNLLEEAKIQRIILDKLNEQYALEKLDQHYKTFDKKDSINYFG